MKQMEGACRFCGQIQTVQAESKDEANRIATLNCNCDEAEAYRRKEDLLALIDQTCADLPKDSGFMSMTTSQLKAMHELGCMIADGHVGKITVDVSDSRCMISKKKDGSFTFERNKVLCLGGGHLELLRGIENE